MSIDQPVPDAPEPAAVGSSRGAGATTILVSTVLAGLATYILQAAVLSALDARQYLQFSVMWSLLYLVIGALAGVQQEVARGAREVTSPARSSGSWLTWFGLGAAGVVFAVVVLSGVFWGPVAISEDTTAIVALLGAGAAGYLCVAILSGMMYGLHRWKTLAILIAVDAGLRLVLVLLTLWLAPTLLALAVAIVVPFPLTFAVVYLAIRSSTRGRVALDVGPRTLTWNSLRTVVGSAATAVMVSGFPFFLGVTSSGQSTQAAAVVAVVTLTRAPLVIPVLALQSFLVVQFRDMGERFGRILLLVLGGIVVVAAAAALLALWLGRDVLAWFGADLHITSAEIAGIVFSAGFTAALCVTGSAALARNAHTAFTVGWVLAAGVVIGSLLLPLDPAPKSVLALIVGPLAGLAVHLVALRRRPVPSSVAG